MEGEVSLGGEDFSVFGFRLVLRRACVVFVFVRFSCNSLSSC